MIMTMIMITMIKILRHCFRGCLHPEGMWSFPPWEYNSPLKIIKMISSSWCHDINCYLNDMTPSWGVQQPPINYQNYHDFIIMMVWFHRNDVMIIKFNLNDDGGVDAYIGDLHLLTIPDFWHRAWHFVPDNTVGKTIWSWKASSHLWG